jgi:hypothetical protein
MSLEPFSKRYRIKPEKEGLNYENVPKSARIGMSYILDTQLDFARQRELYVYICEYLRIPNNETILPLMMYDNKVFGLKEYIKNIFNDAKWYEYYDLCEFLFTFMEPENRESLIKRINTLYIEEHLGFEFRNGKVEKIGSGFTDEKIKEARILLKAPEFKGADQQFEKAIQFFNIRPNSDTENCIKDAVGAIESVGRVLVNNKKALLDDIIKKAVKDGVIPQPLDQTITKLNAYRGSEPGVAHGATGELMKKEDEAELVLSMSAAIIIYLVKKRSKLS